MFNAGSDVVLTCLVDGDPQPYVTWINVTDGSVLQNSSVKTSYVIPSVSSIHKGTYRCVAHNRCGKDSKEMAIIDVYREFVTSDYFRSTWPSSLLLLGQLVLYFTMENAILYCTWHCFETLCTWFTLDPCHPNPCRNKGTCRLLNKDEYKCDCSFGWSGTNCNNNKIGKLGTKANLRF